MEKEEFYIKDKRRTASGQIFNAMILCFGKNYIRTRKDNKDNLIYVGMVDEKPSLIVGIENNATKTKDPVYMRILTEKKYMKDIVKELKFQLPNDFYLEEIVKEKVN